MIPQFGRPVWFVLALLAVSLNAQQTDKVSSEDAEPKNLTKVNLCQLLSKSDAYNDKEVVVQAIYNHGNEWLILYSPDCTDQGSVWLDLSQVKDHAAVKHLGPSRESVTGNLEVQGTYMSGGHFGHLGKYSHQIVAHKVSTADVTAKPPLKSSPW